MVEGRKQREVCLRPCACPSCNLHAPINIRASLFLISDSHNASEHNRLVKEDSRKQTGSMSLAQLQAWQTVMIFVILDNARTAYQQHREGRNRSAGGNEHWGGGAADGNPPREMRRSNCG